MKAALKDGAATADIRVTVEADHGRVSLRGIVLDADERAQTEAVTAAVEGVGAVDNQLRLMATTRRFASAKQT